MAAIFGRGITYGASEQITNTKLHNLVDLLTISNIDVTEIAPDFLSSLATSAGGLKPWNVKDGFFSSLSSLAGGINPWNLNNSFMSSLPTQAGQFHARNFSDNILSSLSSMPGQLRTISMVTSLASGALIRHNGSGGWYASMT